MAEQHLDLLILSSYLDGEAVAPAAIRAHLASCGRCAAHLAELRGVDARLVAAQDLGCQAFRTVLSAELDGEAGAEERTFLERHLAGCQACRQERVAWMILDAELKALPLASPSARVDRAIARRAHTEPIRFPRFASGGGLAVAVTVLVAIAVALAPNVVLTPEPIAQQATPAFVAAVSEQVVVSSATGRIYVLEPEKASLSVYDGASRELLRTLILGGRPVSIGIDESTNTVYVLDALSKSITEIDGSRDAVVASLAVNVTGTPTSLRVDAIQNRLLVTAAGANPDGSGKGELAVASLGTSRAVAVSQVDVAPQRVVVDANAKRLYVAAQDATLVLDATTYAVVTRLPGGAVDLAVSPQFGVVAILSAQNGHSVVTFYGKERSVVDVPGTPRALTALADGGFAVLTELNGQGQIVAISSTGAIGRAVQAAGNARQLAVQPGGALALVGPSGLQITTIAAVEVGQVQTPPKRVEAPSGSGQPQTTTPTQSGAAQPRVAPLTPQRSATVPRDAELASKDTYRLALDADRQPIVLASSGRRLWFVDQRNALAAIDTHDGTLAVVAVLPTGADPSWLWASDDRTYVFDAAGRHLLVLPLGEPVFRVVDPPFAGAVRSLTATPDGRVWLGVDGPIPGLLAYEAATDSFSIVKLPPGVQVNVIRADRSGRVWFGGQRVIGYYDYTNGQLVQVNLPDIVTSVAVDADGSTWAGTATGYLIQLRGTNLLDVVRLEGGIEDILVSSSGTAVFVGRSHGGFAIGPARTHESRGSAVGAARQVVLDDLGRAWYAVGGQPAFFFTVPLEGVQ